MHKNRACLYLRKSVSKTAKAGMITFIAMHLVVTGLIVPLSICSPLLIGLGLRKIDRFRKFGIYSIITSVILFFCRRNHSDSLC